LKGNTTIDLLVLTSLDHVLPKLKILLLLTFFTKQATLMRRSTALSLPLQLEFPVKVEKQPKQVLPSSG
jgi:hypothetical protein